MANVISSIAEVAVPLNHRSPVAELAKTTIKITPETYSGVAVVMIENVESERSVRDRVVTVWSVDAFETVCRSGVEREPSQITSVHG